MKKTILSTIAALMLVTNNMQAKALDAELVSEIEAAIQENKAELPIKLNDITEVSDITFNKNKEEMTTHIIIHADFDSQTVNSQSFKDILASESANIKKEACELELTQSLREYENFKITYVYYSNKINSKNEIFRSTVYASSCN